MNFWRAILASILSLVCTVSLSSFVVLATLQTTLLDRHEVKGWLQDSGVYKNILNNALTSDPTTQQQTSTNPAISADTLKTVLNQTFPASYVQQSTEKVLDSAYDWLDGKQPTIAFSLNTTDQKDAFIAHASAALEPQLAALPQCRSAAEFNAQNPTCLPPGISAGQLSQSLATDAGNDLSFFKEPLTNQSLAEASQPQGAGTGSVLTNPNPATLQLPSLTSALRMWIIWLPIITLISGGLMVWLSHHRLIAAKHLAGKLTFGLILTFSVGLAISYFGGTIKFSSYVAGPSKAMVANIIEPVLRQAAPAIGNRLALVSGIAGAITGGAWIALLIVKKRRDKAQLLRPVTGPTQHAPAQTTDSVPSDKPQA